MLIGCADRRLGATVLKIPEVMTVDFAGSIKSYESVTMVAYVRESILSFGVYALVGSQTNTRLEMG